MNRHHKQILDSIKLNSGQPTQHTFLDSYLGNSHPRYPINNPTLHLIAREWSNENKKMTAGEFQKTLTSLIRGKSMTEKMMAGMLLDYATAEQRKIDPICFEEWLDYLVGWAEVDTLCTGKFTARVIPENFIAWKPIISRLSKSKNINKRRASLALLCSPLRQSTDSRLAKLALVNIGRLQKEKEILITKAISWVLRSMIVNHRKAVEDYVSENREKLPAIAVRETLTKLRTGKKSGK